MSHGSNENLYQDSALSHLIIINYHLYRSGMTFHFHVNRFPPTMLCVDLGCYYQFSDSVEGDFFFKVNNKLLVCPSPEDALCQDLNEIGRVLLELFNKLLMYFYSFATISL